MIFGRLPVRASEGAILAHAVRAGGRLYKKGHRLTVEDGEILAAAGIAWVMAARLERDDVGEDEAAARLAGAAAGANVAVGAAFTGRANLFADVHGLAVLDRDVVTAVNSVDEAITIATVPPHAVVEPGQMVATVKIIPFAVSETAIARAVALAGGLVSVAPFVPHVVGLVQTTLPGTKPSVLAKTAAVTQARLAALGGRLGEDLRCPHDFDALVDALNALRARGCAPILIVGASAITDRRDVIPAAIEAVGGRIDHFGMPVDPGNLLLLGRDAVNTPIVGLPGCARSPRFNGVDWVLQRLLAGIAVTSRDIMAMGAGGLLAEIAGRPQPRAGGVPGAAPRSGGAPTAGGRAPRVGAIILAAGRSRRMAGRNKLLATVGGIPMVRRAAEAALGSKARPIVCVVGHEGEQVRAALAGLDLVVVDNPDHAQGLSTSLRRGLAALPLAVDGALICLGDMPLVTARDLDRLIDAFAPHAGRAICVPSFKGKRGNPVLWARRFFAEMEAIEGDIGARHLIGVHADQVREVDMDSDEVLIDVDTPDALRAIDF